LRASRQDRNFHVHRSKPAGIATDDMPLTKKGKSPADLAFKLCRNDGGRTPPKDNFEFTEHQNIDLT
jgi:hypothetical protein